MKEIRGAQYGRTCERRGLHGTVRTAEMHTLICAVIQRELRGTILTQRSRKLYVKVDIFKFRSCRNDKLLSGRRSVRKRMVGLTRRDAKFRIN